MENERISELVKKQLHENAVSITELKKGRVYLVETIRQKIVVKITKLEWAVDETFFLSQIQKIGVPSPKLLSSGVFEISKGFLILEYIPNCQSILDDSLRRNDSLWVQLAEGIKKIHEVPVSGFGFNTSRIFGEQNFANKTFRDFLNNILSELENDLQNTDYIDLVHLLKDKNVLLREYIQAYLVHGDLGGNNFLWKKEKEKLYFFDAGYCRGMPKNWDVAYFGWRTGEDRVTDEDVEKLSSLYFNNEKTKEDEFEIAFMRALIGLIKIRDGLNSDKLMAYILAVQKQIKVVNLLSS